MSAIPNKHRKSKKCNKTKRHIANYKMNTPSQNTKTKRQHHYASQKHQRAPIQSPETDKPAKQQTHNNNNKNTPKQKNPNKTDTRRKEEAAVKSEGVTEPSWQLVTELYTPTHLCETPSTEHVDPQYAQTCRAYKK